MHRINVYDYTDDGYLTSDRLAGWFDADAATDYAEQTRWDGNNHISVPTGSQWDHELLYRTKSGRWVLGRWSQRQGTAATCEFIDGDRAKDWLLANDWDDAAAEHFGPIEDEHGPGRPEIGPAINIRLPGPLLTAVDTWAQAHDLTRAAAIRTLLAAQLPA